VPRQHCRFWLNSDGLLTVVEKEVSVGSSQCRVASIEIRWKEED